MTTDNRTNEPNQNETKSGQGFCFTEAQVEAALDALSRFNEWTENPRGAMRAALVAAQGAAPQAESDRLDMVAWLRREQGFELSPMGKEYTDEKIASALASQVVQQVSEAAGVEPQTDGVAYEFLDIVFDGPPGPESGRFVEIERPGGSSCKPGDWIDRRDGLWAFRIPRSAPTPVQPSSTVDEDALARLLCEKNYLSPDGKPTCAECRDKAHEVAEWLKEQGR